MRYYVGIFYMCLIGFSELQSASPRMLESRISFADFKKAICFNAIIDLKLLCILDATALRRWIDCSDEYGYTLLDYAILGQRNTMLDILTTVPLNEKTYVTSLRLANMYGYDYAIKKLLGMQKRTPVDTEELINLRKGCHVTLQPIAEVDDKEEADSGDEKRGK